MAEIVYIIDMSGLKHRRHRRGKAFTAYVAAHDTESLDSVPRARASPLVRTSWYIGKGCVAMAAQNEQQAREYFAQGNDCLQGARTILDNPAHRDHINMRFLSDMLMLLQNRYEDGILESGRQRLRQTAIDGLKQEHERFSRIYRQPAQSFLNANVTEWTTLGLLNSVARPGKIVLPALFHQDCTPDRSRNFDAVLISSSRHQPVQSEKIQVKSQCVKVCTTRRRMPDLPMQENYNEDITLVSGHCDFRQKPRVGDFEKAFPVAAMLLDSEDSTPKAMRPLEQLAANLMKKIIEDPRRKGLIALAPDSVDSDASASLPIPHEIPPGTAP